MSSLYHYVGITTKYLIILKLEYWIEDSWVINNLSFDNV